MYSEELPARVDSGPYWQLVSELMSEDETAVHCAHVRCVQGGQDLLGTLFLTSRRLIWRVIDPRDPEGSGFEVPVDELLDVERPTRLAMFRAFRLVHRVGASNVDSYFFPKQKSDVERLLCDQMFHEIADAWSRTRELRLPA